MYSQFLIALLVSAICSSSSYVLNRYSLAKTATNIKCVRLNAVNKDLFSDDLFEEDEESDKKPIKKDQTEPLTSSRKYLDQNWKLNDQDAKEFKGLPKRDAVAAKLAKNDIAEKLPMFALMYKFRKEYADGGAESIIADHKGHCTKFPRLANSQQINIAKARGSVTLFVGESDKDKDATKAEIMSFIEEDPLIEKDIVETWDLIDLSEKGSSADLPSSVSK